MKKILVLLLVAIVTLVVAACGVGGGAEPPQVDTPEITTPPPETPPEPPPPPPEPPAPPEPPPAPPQEELNYEISDHELVGTIIEFGGYGWRVLNVRGDRALIITEEIIGFRSYHGCWETPWYAAPPREELATTWADSDIRQNLNSEFFNSFNEEDRARIAEISVVNNDNPWLDTPGGADTTDRIFLLSIEEVVRYFGDSGYLQNPDITDPWSVGFHDQYRESRFARIRDGVDLPEWAFYLPDGVTDIRRAASQWWLRSPGKDSTSAAMVCDFGSLWLSGAFVSRANGVRPAMWVYIN